MTAVKGVLWKVHFKRKTLHELRRNCRSFSQNSLFHIITINRTSICRVELHVLYFCQDVWWDVYFWRKKPTITSLITAIHFYNFLVMKFKSVFTLKMSGVVARIGMSTTFPRPQKCDIFMKHSLIRSLIRLHSILGIMKCVIPRGTRIIKVLFSCK